MVSESEETFFALYFIFVYLPSILLTAIGLFISNYFLKGRAFHLQLLTVAHIEEIIY
jgi:hypothetical protein